MTVEVRLIKLVNLFWVFKDLFTLKVSIKFLFMFWTYSVIGTFFNLVINFNNSISFVVWNYRNNFQDVLLVLYLLRLECVW